MADENDWKPGDDTNVILRKILTRLAGISGGGSGGAVTVTSGNIDVTGSVTANPAQGALTNGSGSITTGGASQQIFAANASRKYLIVQNISSENLYINFGGSAAVDDNSLKMLPNGSFAMEGSFVSTESINIIGATTGSKFVAKQG